MSAALQSKISRAVKALLISSGAGTTSDTFAAPSGDDRQIPNTTIDAGSASELHYATGNWRFQGVTVQLRDSATTQPDETNPLASLDAAVSRLNAVSDALSLVGGAGELTYTADAITAAGRALAVSDPDNNSDMADLTLIHWRPISFTAPQVSADGAFWESEIVFDCIACNSALSA